MKKGECSLSVRTKVEDQEGVRKGGGGQSRRWMEGKQRMVWLWKRE